MRTSIKIAAGVTGLILAAGAFLAYRVYGIMSATVTPNHDYPAEVAAIMQAATSQWRPAGDYQRVLDLTQPFVDAETRILVRNDRRPTDRISLDVLLEDASSIEDCKIAQQMLDDHVQSGRLTPLRELPSLVGVRRRIPAGQPMTMRDTPELSAFRSATRAMAVVAQLQFRAGDVTQLPQTVEELLALGVIAASQPTSIDHLMGCAIQARAFDLIREACASKRLDDATVRVLLHLVDKYRLPRVRDLQLQTERLILRDAIQWSYTDDGDGNGRFSPVGAANLASAKPAASELSTTNPAAAFLYVDRKTIERACDEYFRLAAEQEAKPAHERDLSALAKSTDAWGTDHFVLNILAPSLSKIIAADTNIQLQREGVRVLLALEAFRAKNNRYPASIDELVPGFLSALPTDEWAPDGRFTYRLLVDSQDGREFLLYSIGADKRDDAGKHVDSALSTDSVRGDFIFNVPSDRASKPE